MMSRLAFACGLSAALLLGTPVLAVTAKDKMETCKFGADDQKLAGAARKSFMSKCMAQGEARASKTKAKKPQ